MPNVMVTWQIFGIPVRCGLSTLKIVLSPFHSLTPSFLTSFLPSSPPAGLKRVTLVKDPVKGIGCTIKSAAGHILVNRILEDGPIAHTGILRPGNFQFHYSGQVTFSFTTQLTNIQQEHNIVSTTIVNHT